MINWFIRRYLKKARCDHCLSGMSKIFIWDNGDFYCSNSCLQKTIMGIESVPTVPKEIEKANQDFLKAYKEILNPDTVVTSKLKDKDLV